MTLQANLRVLHMTQLIMKKWQKCKKTAASFAAHHARHITQVHSKQSKNL
jgi:hypothetical protein